MPNRSLLSAAVLCLGFGAAVASADPITLYNTGVSSANNPDGTNSTVITTGGATDPHYTVVSTPSSSASTPAKVVTDQGAYFRPGYSQYINDVGSANGNEAVGNYDYQTTFDLTGLDPTTATLSGTFYVDDKVTDVLLNGNSTGISGTGFGSGPGTSFTIPAGSKFVPGVNTLDFIVQNGGSAPNPTAFDVTLLKGTASAVPEPAAMGLLGASVAGLLARRRRA